jgi:hypothetical protein
MTIRYNHPTALVQSQGVGQMLTHPCSQQHNSNTSGSKSVSILDGYRTKQSKRNGFSLRGNGVLVHTAVWRGPRQDPCKAGPRQALQDPTHRCTSHS